MAEAQRPYGKSLFFSKLQLIPVKEDEQKPVEAVQKPDINTSERKRRKE
jgi:hypothetical protein